MMTYEDFTVYPLEIQGITDASDEKIEAIAEWVTEQIDYSGADADLDDILPFFVFFHFLEDLMTDASVRTGETAIIREESNFNSRKMQSAWNQGATKLTALISENEETCNENYISLRNDL
jgi:hypothetical protein